MARSLKVRPEYIEKIKQAVTGNGYISQRALAEELGFSLATINNFLNGKFVDRRYFIDICQRLACDADEIGEFEVKRQSLAELEQQTATGFQELHEVRIDVSRFYGRTAELNNLSQRIINEQCQVFVITGMSGVGKTAIAANFVQQIEQAALSDITPFQPIIWRSLRYAPAITDLLTELLSILTEARSIATTSTLDGLISQLLVQLRQQRCLIVLDDWESILQAGKFAGYCTAEHEGYSRLLKRLAEETHHSCLLILSREQPIEITPWLGEHTTVHLLNLTGLTLREAEQLMIAKGFVQHAPGLTELIEVNRGNPAALQLAAATIRELFDSNITAFLAQTSLVIGDVFATRLEQQFERLSVLEKSLLFWIAVSGRAATLGEFKQWLPSRSRSDLVAALESLRRRSLIEKTVLTPTDCPLAFASETIHFSLEPVIMKFVLQQFIAQICRDLDSTIRSRSFSSLGLNSHPFFLDDCPNDHCDRLLQQLYDWLVTYAGGSVPLVTTRLQELLILNQPTGGFAASNINHLLAYAKRSSPP